MAPQSLYFHRLLATSCVLLLLRLSEAKIVRVEDMVGNVMITIPPQPRVLPPNDAYLALCTLSKDTHPDDVLEWLVHHIALGVGHIYWYDHHSSADLSRLVAPFVQAGYLTWHKADEPHLEDAPRNMLLPMYNHCLTAYSPRHEWIGMIDSDEYLWLPGAKNPGTGLPQLLKEYEAHGGLAVNWVLYGSSGHETRPPGTVLQSFTKCVPAHNPATSHDPASEYPQKIEDLTRHVKTILHTGRGPLATFWFKNSHGPMDPLHSTVVDELFRSVPNSWMTSNHTRERIQLLHVILGSKESFEAKMLRGGGAGGYRKADLFELIESYSTGNCNVVSQIDNE